MSLFHSPIAGFIKSILLNFRMTWIISKIACLTNVNLLQVDLIVDWFDGSVHCISWSTEYESCASCILTNLTNGDYKYALIDWCFFPFFIKAYTEKSNLSIKSWWNSFHSVLVTCNDDIRLINLVWDIDGKFDCWLDFC